MIQWDQELGGEKGLARETEREAAKEKSRDCPKVQQWEQQREVQ